MKPRICTLLGLTAALAVQASAQTVVFSNNFATGYTNGNLVGQNGWTLTGSATNNPLQITNSRAVIGTSGQDAWNAFSTVLTNADYVGGYALTKISLSLDSAQATGDYFFHLSSPTNTTTAFYQRLYARSTNTGFQLGISASSTNLGNLASYGSTILSFSNTYTAVLKWNFVAGGFNDTFSLYVDPVGDLATNPVYATATFATNEPTNLAAANFRQGSAANAPVVRVDSITVEIVPEPSTFAMLGLAGLGFAGYMLRRRRRG